MLNICNTFKSYCQGTIDVQKINVKYDQKEITFPCDDISDLILHSYCATFGKNNVEVLDTSYRNAHYLKMCDYSTDFDPYKYNIIDTIESHMGDEQQHIKIVRDKLNIYGENNHFSKHKDTPQSPDMIGTLVVCLPQKFTGGNLMLYCDNDINISFENTDVIQWCAFYGDIDHEILKVISGHRVTITYQILKTAQIINPDNHIVSSIEKLIETIPNNLIGYKCKYLYSGENPSFKGQDAMVYDTLQKLNHKPQMINITHYDFNDDSCYIHDNNDNDGDDIILCDYTNDINICFKCSQQPNFKELIKSCYEDEDENHLESVFFCIDNKTNIYKVEGHDVESKKELCEINGKQLNSSIYWLNNPLHGQNTLYKNSDIMYGNYPTTHEEIYRSCAIIICRDDESMFNLN